MAPTRGAATVLVAPLWPDPDGVGVARRGFALLRAIVDQGAPADVVVLHVYGGRADPPPAVRALARACRRIAPEPFLDTHAALIGRFGQGSSAYPRPWAMRFSTDRAGRAVADSLAADVGTVLIQRLTLAPLAPAIATARPGADLILDLDEDDALREARLAGMGLADPAEAVRWAEAQCGFTPPFHGLIASTGADAERIGKALARPVSVLPNPAPEPGPAARLTSGETLRILFVGGLDYAPNADAVRWLSEDIVPALRRLWAGPLAVDVVGSGDPALAPPDPVVTLHGWVPDLAPIYARADVAVAPLRAGAGSRLKILEAFAAGAPAVSTTLGAEGLDVADGRDIALADDAEAFAAACVRLKCDPQAAAAQAAAARRGLDRRHGREALSRAWAAAQTAARGGRE